MLLFIISCVIKDLYKPSLFLSRLLNMSLSCFSLLRRYCVNSSKSSTPSWLVSPVSTIWKQRQSETAKVKEKKKVWVFGRYLLGIIKSYSCKQWQMPHELQSDIQIWIYFTEKNILKIVFNQFKLDIQKTNHALDSCKGTLSLPMYNRKYLQSLLAQIQQRWPRLLQNTTRSRLHARYAVFK